ncbi:uncharacterized protein LOC114438363 [Parambassis ranga]|uniref:Uncharacterized protein LOC114438363 n=1 Tax=Parambassis ranga TaxID=210632 RepID=A0A6P7IV80_9TELE|nr:uncharacterized protein LOC114438363 [Parambassis ranga]
MDEGQLSERCVRAGLEMEGKMACHEVEEQVVCTNGAVTMETKWAEEEERWRKLFPDLKRCAVVISRLSLKGEQAKCDWTQPLEHRGRFIKKVVVIQRADHWPKKPPCQLKRSGVPGLRPCADVRSDPAHLCSNGCTKDHHGDSSQISQSEIEHNYCLTIKDTPDASSLSQERYNTPDVRVSISCRQVYCSEPKDGDCTRSEKNVPHIVFKKVQTDQWELMRSQVQTKKEEDTDTSAVQRKKENQPTASTKPSPTKKRQVSCGQCDACVRKNCGSCSSCRDMRKFGGPSRLKQKCVFRRCMMMRRSKVLSMLPEEQILPRLQNPAQVGKDTVTVATTAAQKQLAHWRRQRDEKQQQEEVAAERHRRRQEVKEVRKKRRQRRKAKKQSKDEKWTPPLLKETLSPQFPLIGGTEVTLPDGTRLQLSLTLDGSHFAPSMLCDSALSFLSCLPQDGLLHVSTGLTDITPAPPAAPLQPKEEEEAVDISLYGRRGAEETGEGEFSEGVGEEGRFCDVEVLLQDSDEETLTCSPHPSDITVEDTGTAADVTASNHAHKPPEFIQLSLGSFSLLGGGVSDDITDGQGLLHLLRVLRRTVLPAHWVAVLADGPQLQLLQCSRLSSMVDTVVHIQPDHCFYVTVQQHQLPDAHRLYHTHTHRITHLSQLVSLLLELERLNVCRGSRVRSSATPLQLQSPDCHLLVVPPLYTCLPCLLEGEEEEEEEDVEFNEEEEEKVEEEDTDL